MWRSQSLHIWIPTSDPVIYLHTPGCVWLALVSPIWWTSQVIRCVVISEAFQLPPSWWELEGCSLRYGKSADYLYQFKQLASRIVLLLEWEMQTGLRISGQHILARGTRGWIYRERIIVVRTLLMGLLDLRDEKLCLDFLSHRSWLWLLHLRSVTNHYWPTATIVLELRS